MANRNGKTQRSRSNTAATPTVESTALALPQITRARANDILKARAVELYHQARSAQQHEQRAFEDQFGRADRIDAPLLAELQHLQMRFAAIAARQQRQPSGNEPKVNRFVKALGEITGTSRSHLPQTEPWNSSRPSTNTITSATAITAPSAAKATTSPCSHSIASLTIPNPSRQRTIRDDDPDEVCLHEAVEPDEDEPTRGTCADCGAEFDLTLSPPTES